MGAGIVLGAGAGVALSLADFGASWLWVSGVAARVELLPRTLALLVPIASLFGALFGLVAFEGSRLIRRFTSNEARWAPLPSLAVVSPGIVAIAHLLFTGGSMSRLALRPLFVVVAAIALFVAGYVGLRFARALFRWSLDAPTARRRTIALLLFGVFFAISKANQHLYPNLYDYLHALLAVLEALFVALGLAIGWRDAARAQSFIAHRFAVPVALFASLALLVLDLTTLGLRPNVRVALIDVRAPASRAAMQALAPLFGGGGDRNARARDIARAQEERRARQRALDGRDLPTAPEAHILLITVDALRADHLGTYGYRREIDGQRVSLSPNIDRFATSAVVFEHAYTQAPHSSYSITTLMTSEYVHETVELEATLPAATLPSTLESDGYTTAAFFTIGIFHTEGELLTQYRDESFGFDRFDHTDTRCAAKTDAVLAEVDRIVAEGEPKSLIWVHYFDVHEPYRDASLGNEPMDRYDAEIRNVDREVGRLLREVDARFDRDVVVVLTADHGEEFRDHGGVYHGSTLYEEQIRVPLLVRAPGLASRRVARPVELVDVTPTLLGLVTVPRAPSMRGDDLRGLLAGANDDTGPAFSAVLRRRAVVAWPYKLIADLRFNTYELFDLVNDPRERTNLAGSHPDRTSELTGEVYAWLDTLRTPAGGTAELDPRALAIDRGRLGDRRAVPELSSLIADERAPREQRAEAAQILGYLADETASPSLERALHSIDPVVAAEAAIAMGRMVDDRAKPALVTLMYAEDPDLRSRAAISLARLRDRAAVPSLIEGLWTAKSTYDREEAVRWLGRLRDPRGVEPLLTLLPDFRLRHITVVALGMIGDERAYEPLVEMLGWEHHQNIRDNVMRALGQLGDRRAVPEMVEVARNEPDLKQAAEALVRLGAYESELMGGLDAVQGPRLIGFARCTVGPIHHDWDYVHRTFCETEGPRAEVRARVPAAIADDPAGAVIVLDARRLDGAGRMPVRVMSGGRELGRVEPDAQWTEARIPVPAGVLSRGDVTFVLQAEVETGRFALDHLLVLPPPGAE